MADPSIHNTIAQAVLLLVGGLLTTGGGAVTQIVTHHLAVKRETATRRRDRIEAFVKALFANEQWTVSNFFATFSGKEVNENCPLDEARMIQNLHFPELQQDLEELLNLHVKLLEFVGYQKMQRKKDENAWLKSYDPIPFYKSYAVYIAKDKAIAEKCRAMISKNGTLTIN